MSSGVVFSQTGFNYSFKSAGIGHDVCLMKAVKKAGTADKTCEFTVHYIFLKGVFFIHF